MKISDTELINIFVNNSIPEEYVRKISKADAFRRASSSIKRRKVSVIANSATGFEDVHVEVDEIRSDKDSIKRIIGIKRIDNTSEDIKYDPVAEVIFNRSSEQCATSVLLPIADPDYTEISNLCSEVINNYTDWSVYHNKDTVKNIINRIINDTHPVNLMPTGLCKFIPSGSTDLLYNLQSALEELSQYVINGSSKNIMEIIPVIDTDEQRELVEKNFTAEVTNELFEFTQELKNVITTKQTIGTRSANSYVEKFKTLQSKAKEYESLLGIYVTALHQQIKEAIKLVDDNKES